MFVSVLLPLCVAASWSLPLQHGTVRKHGFLRQSVDVADFMDEQYYVQVNIGTPIQYFTLLVDTGSSNVWVPSASCFSMSCWAHNTYSGSASSSFKPNGTAISIQYESGFCSGQFASDLLVLGNFTTRLTFASMNIVSPQFTHVQFDGILGLAWPALAVGGVPTLFEVLKANNEVTSSSFSLYLTNDTDPNQSQLIFGEPNQELYIGELMYFPVANKSYWSVEVTELLVGRYKIENSGTFALVDSGASGIAGSEEVVGQITKYIIVSSDCSNLSQLPPLTIEIGGKTLLLAAEDYVIVSILGSVKTCTSPFQVVDMTLDGHSALVLGASFLRGFVTYFDFDNSRMGFAPRANQ